VNQGLPRRILPGTGGEVPLNLAPLYAQEQEEDKMVYAKFFTPWTNWTWYATEGSQQEDDFLFFGYVFGFEGEWGYFSLNELQSTKGPAGLTIERDLLRGVEVFQSRGDDLLSAKVESGRCIRLRAHK
jgi:hypothetical protein